MEIKEMTIEELTERKSAIAAEVDAPEADLDALEAEARSINEELEARKLAESKRNEIRDAVAQATQPEIIENFVEERKETKMTELEIRSSKEYVDAYAEYMKTGNDAECRSLLTETASGTVPVPVIVEQIVRTAWDNDQILSRVKKTFIRGNLKVAFERSADGAYVHNEGTTAPTEESLLLGIVTMVPRNVKKWITVSDEALALGGEAFLRYIYDEITYQIVKKLVALGVADIAGSNNTNGATAPGCAKITVAPALDTIASAYSLLSDEATNPVIIMNKATYADFITAQAAGNFAFDPFMGLPVLFCNSLPAYSTASTNAVYAIVGDLKGLQYNFPEGEGVALKFDDLSLAEKDMVKVVGREYAAHAVTAPFHFTNIAKPAAATT